MMRLRRWLLTCLWLGAASCAPTENVDLVVRRDSAGVAITESAQPQWTGAQGWIVDSVPLLDLGAAGSGPEHEFYLVRNATRLRDGRIAVANFGTNEVRFYGSDGRYLLSAGRDGQGPGEFERLTSVQTYRGDSLVAFDAWARRITFLDPSGVVARVASLTGLDGSLSELHALSDGGFLLHTHAIEVMAEVEGRVRVPAPLLLLTADGTVRDTLAVVPGFETYVFDQGDAAPPLRHEVHVAVRDMLVYVGDGTSLEYHILGEDGAVRRVARIPGYDLEVSESVRDSMRAAMLQQEMPPFLRPTQEAMANSIPTRRPAYSGLLVDPNGFVWLAEYGASPVFSPEPRPWLVFDPRGAWLGTVDLPPNFDLFEVGEDYVLGRARDELGVETVQLLGLDRL
jgi:hypothetical protein